MSKSPNSINRLPNAINKMQAILSQNIQAIILLTSALATGCIETPRPLRDAPEQTQALVDQHAPNMNLVTQDMQAVGADMFIEADMFEQEDQDLQDMLIEADMNEIDQDLQDMLIEADMNEIDQEVQDMFMEADMQTPAQDMFIEEDMQAPQADMMVEPEQTCQVELVSTSRLNTFVLGSAPNLYSFQINTNIEQAWVHNATIDFLNLDGELEDGVSRAIEQIVVRDTNNRAFNEWVFNGVATMRDLEELSEGYNIILQTTNTGRDSGLPFNDISTVISATLENQQGDRVVCEPANTASFNLTPMVLKFPELNTERVDLNWGLNRNLSFDFNVNTNLDENLNEFNSILSGRLTNVTFAIQTQNVDLSSLIISDNQGLARNTINVAGQTLDLFSVELEEPIILESGDTSVAIDLDVSNMQPDGFISLEVIDVTYSTGFREHQVTQAITTEPVILITQD